MAAAAGAVPSELRLLDLAVFENSGDAARFIVKSERLYPSPKRRGETSRGPLMEVTDGKRVRSPFCHTNVAADPSTGRLAAGYRPRVKLGTESAGWG